MNNTTPIKILTAAVLLTFGFALTANAALINKGVTEMNHEAWWGCDGDASS